MQRETPCLWALVNPDAPMETRTFRVVGTGHDIPPDGADYLWYHVGTFQMHGGYFVGHLFEQEAVE